MGAQKIEEKKTYRITGVEIFSAGTWNGIEHTVTDLHALATSFSALKPGWIPSLKLGHDKNQQVARSSGLPSVGWVDRVYVIGDKLLADFDNIPEQVFRLIEKKAYRKVSCEIYYGVKVGDASYSHVLAAVALLGSELPGVMNLNDILGQYSKMSDGEVFAILEKQDTFNSYSRKFELQQTEDQVSKTELELKLEKENAEQKAQFEALQAEKAELEKQAKEFQEFKAQAEADKVKAELEKKEANLKAFVADLKTKNLITKATEPMILDLLGDKKEFKLEEKPVTREELFEKVLTLTVEAAKVNFEESSLAEFKKGDQSDDEKAIQEYMDKNKCSYEVAYKACMKAKK